MTVEDRGVTIEDRGVSIEDRGVTIEDRGVSIEDRGVTIEDRGVSQFYTAIDFLSITAFHSGLASRLAGFAIALIN